MDHQPYIPPDSIRVRASGLATAFDCAHRWEGDVLLGLHMPSSPRAVLGTAVHGGTAVFDLATMQGNPVSVADAADVVVDLIRNGKEEVNWTGSDLRPKEVEKIALDLYWRYCTEWAPKFTFSAVELSVKPLTIDAGDGVKLTLTGTLDRMRIVRGPDGLPRVKDLKTGRAAVVEDPVTKRPRAAANKHRAQIGVYEILSAHTLQREVDTTSDVLGMSTTGRRDIATGEVSGSRELVLGRGEDEPGLIDFLADNLRAGRFPPNPASPLCSKRYCARWSRCSYRSPDEKDPNA